MLHKYLLQISWPPHGVRIIIPTLKIQNWGSEREVACPVSHISSNGRTRVQTYVHLTPRSLWYILLPPWAFPEAKNLSVKCRRCGFDPWVGKIPWRRKWQPTPWVVFLTRKSQGQKSLVGYSPWGHKRIGLNSNNIASLLKIYNFPRFFQQCENYFFWA